MRDATDPHETKIRNPQNPTPSYLFTSKRLYSLVTEKLDAMSICNI